MEGHEESLAPLHKKMHKHVYIIMKSPVYRLSKCDSIFCIQEGTSEQYEQVVFSVWPIRAALTLHNLVCWIEGHSSAAIIALPPITALAFMVIRRWML